MTPLLQDNTQHAHGFSLPWRKSEVLVSLALAYYAIPALVHPFLVTHLPKAFQSNLLLQPAISTFSWIFLLAFFVLKCPAPRWQNFSATLGFSAPSKPPLKTVFDHLLPIVGILFITLSLSLLISWLGVSQPEAAPNFKPLSENFSVTSRFLFMALSLTLVPLMEEIVFRGLLQSILLTQYTPAYSLMATALIFTVCHGLYWPFPLAMAYTFCIGVLLGWVRFKTNSLWPAITGHALNNLMAFFSVYNF